VLLHWSHLPESGTLDTLGGVVIPFRKVAAPRC
jgi:hypothetical protein